MQIGVVFPQTEIGSAHVSDLRRYATTVEGLGYRHLLVYDHVLGADPQVHAPWTGPYDIDTTFREPFVFLGHLAAFTTLELVTGVIILPQRQTALVAKQAAEVALLAEGRLRLGVGLGWNAVEYEALGQRFDQRGRRLSEQIPLLRRLLSERIVTHDGEFDRITGAGIAPLPRTPVPIWIGGRSPQAYRRAGRLADGWFPLLVPGPELDEARAIIADAAVEAGRDPASIGMDGRVGWSADGGIDRLLDHAGRWKELGATHLSVSTMNAGLGSLDRHLEVLAEVAGALGLDRTDR
ncbi:LLM class F420-dependent oxidoreductase [Desertimonas flava]|uniref:LLM class F420-dependent oxidoreductase n=1 Tax=Desertimonas flava TaxID=2064846 RepID=UPI000E34D9D6|nr:LLM class F420-dependent oxidoreductase [Desertimonas flava]